VADERWRLFVAVPIGDELRTKLAAAVDEWRKRPDLAGLRWTDPESWHVTLAFLGATDPDRVGEITSTMRRVAARHPTMQLPTGGIGGFPSARRARVAWYGVDDRGRALASLARALRGSLRTDARGPFRAHVTLGRAGRSAVDVQGWTRGTTAPIGELSVERIELLRSYVSRSGARYELVANAPVGTRDGP